MCDERRVFSRAEVLAALSLVASSDDADALAAELLQAPPSPLSDTSTHYVHLSDDLLDLLSLASEDCAERVRIILQLTPQQARQRREAARTRFRV